MSDEVGVLKGIITLDASAVTKGLGDAAGSVEHFAKRAKKMANDFAMVGAAIAGGVVAAVAKVADVSPVAHASMENLTNATQTLGIQIAKVAAPAIKVMADSLRDVANYLAGLSPQTKQHIADIVILAAQVAVAALAFGRLMEVMKGLSALFEGLTVVLGVVFSPVGLAIAAVIAALLVLRQAWISNWGGFRDTVRSVISDISGYWAKFTGFLGDLWSKQVDDAADGLKAIVQLYFAAQKMMADAGITKANPLAGIEEQTIKHGIDMAKGVAKSPQAAGQLALDIGKSLKAGAMDMAAEFKKKLADLIAALGLKSDDKTKADNVDTPAVRAFKELVDAQQRSSMLSQGARALDVTAQKTNFADIGAGPLATIARITAGFSGFDDALLKGTESLNQQRDAIDQAKQMELLASQTVDENLKKSFLDAAAGLELVAQKSGDAAKKAADAAKAYEDQQKKYKVTPEDSWQTQVDKESSKLADDFNKWRNGLGSITDVVGDFVALMKTELLSLGGAMAGLKVGLDAFAQNTGKLGQTINAGIQGFQSGGPWGAIIAVVMQFLTQVKGWTNIVNIGNGQFQQALNSMSKGLNNLIRGFEPLMGAIGFIASAVHQVLNPVLTLIGTILKGIAPILTVFGVVLQVVAGTIGPLVQIIGGILDPLFKVLAVTLSPLVLLFMYLKVAVDGVALGFQKFVEWTDEIIGKHDNQGNVDAAQAQFDSDKAAADAFASAFANNPFDALQTLNQNAADAANSLGRTSDAANSVTESLLNVPDGIKVAAYAYSASNATGGGGAPAYSSNSGIGSMRQRYLSLGTTVDPSRYPKKKP